MLPWITREYGGCRDDDKGIGSWPVLPSKGEWDCHHVGHGGGERSYGVPICRASRRDGRPRVRPGPARFSVFPEARRHRPLLSPNRTFFKGPVALQKDRTHVRSGCADAQTQSHSCPSQGHRWNAFEAPLALQFPTPPTPIFRRSRVTDVAEPHWGLGVGRKGKLRARAVPGAQGRGVRWGSRSQRGWRGAGTARKGHPAGSEWGQSRVRRAPWVDSEMKRSGGGVGERAGRPVGRARARAGAGERRRAASSSPPPSSLRAPRRTGCTPSARAPERARPRVRARERPRARLPARRRRGPPPPKWKVLSPRRCRCRRPSSESSASTLPAPAAVAAATPTQARPRSRRPCPHQPTHHAPRPKATDLPGVPCRAGTPEGSEGGGARTRRERVPKPSSDAGRACGGGVHKRARRGHGGEEPAGGRATAGGVRGLEGRRSVQRRMWRARDQGRKERGARAKGCGGGRSEDGGKERERWGGGRRVGGEDGEERDRRKMGEGKSQGVGRVGRVAKGRGSA